MKKWGAGGAVAIRAGLLVCCAMAVAALPSQGGAQRTGSRVGGVEAGAKRSVMTPDAIRQMVSQYATCTIRNRRSSVELYLATPPDSSESDRLFGKIRDEDCLASGELTIADADYRGAAYAELYRLDYSRLPELDLTNKSRIDYKRDRDLQVPLVRTHVAVRQFADCVVRAAPAESRALVLSRIGTNEERGAFAALAPYLGPCVFEGDKVSFSKGPLRAVVGEVLYLLSKAPAAAPEPAAKT